MRKLLAMLLLRPFHFFGHAKLLAALMFHPFRFAENVLSSMRTKLYSKDCLNTGVYVISVISLYPL